MAFFLLQGMTDANQDGMLILQESCTDASGSSLVVYSPIDLLTANVVMSGEDASAIPMLPSGFVILPDARPGTGAAAGGRRVRSHRLRLRRLRRRPRTSPAWRLHRRAREPVAMAFAPRPHAPPPAIPAASHATCASGHADRGASACPPLGDERWPEARPAG